MVDSRNEGRAGAESEAFFNGRTKATGAWTTIAEWREDAGSLMALFTYGSERHATSVLPYGLERLGSRRLVMALPRSAAAVTRNRVALLDAEVSLHSAGGAFQQEIVPARSEAIDWYGALGGLVPLRDTEALDGPPWLVRLIDWLESRRVERVRRSQYWSWHYRGRQILNVRRGRSVVSLVAGVDYRSPREDQPAPLRVDLSANDEPPEEVMERIRLQLDETIERRRTGVDRAHREHLLQGALAVDPALLGLHSLHREYPAWRPGMDGRAGRGFIDFLGVDIDGGLHVIETKIGPDHMLGVQGLDYWAWVTAHKAEIARQVDADPDGGPVELHYVLACSSRPILHAAAAATIARLAGEIPWRCHVIRDWNTVDQPNQLLRPHSVPRIEPRTIPDPSVCKAVTN